ncbi:protein ALP1-like [Pararge aegeria]|uniref:Jg21286 protein n=1 Tax=Pararge aegeria aegeria TaxID=348720 RepID=A0A8S4SAG5_9NEOP|nr:protein ALP1-like [Pararge aegeria]CAH2264554.1 jg21286 [Pararge aegeria aegeria]
MAHKALLALLGDTLSSKSDSSGSSSWSDLSSIRSEFSEDDDDEDRLFFPLMQYLIRLKRKRVDDYLHIIESWTDVEFRNRLGLSRKIAYSLIDDLEKSGCIANHKFGLKPLEPRLCFYIFLSFIANTEPLTPIATRFDISISSTFRVIRRIVAWILTKMDEAIKWPQDISDYRTICDSFHSKTGISNILGVIDCTHVKIEKPKNAREYCNPKGYYSIVLQATIDANLRFTNIYCGEPGSTSCARILRKSPIYHTASQDQSVLFPLNTFLVGHSGYPSLTWLVPPFRENKRLTLPQREFNTLHAATRKLSDKAFNLLKSRFKRVKLFTVYRNVAFITDTIVAACILHNYCIEESIFLELNAGA